ncbi:DUF1559 domain-containing protein [Rhodopirellula sp. JC740]|uniref:DUF1559 domain-containing protein n=1 Tax=Rhodopirellula halodulae TaxID=2894198 RepID=A0ABS8NKG5_9BACT|nr:MULTISPECIES: DUF1559 domain-containing protein [unclassified Rhodopirellula]MCC9644056.1 DUF1559 domain-containing protein [Rhodopirellula sp. JC740]MCC9657218.1 DUF1559 domain-containing protein [Rhodopirellula sp. JC737]
MTFLFTCPHCQSQTEVEDQYSGRTGDCAVCGREITLPDFAFSRRKAVPNAARKKSVVRYVAAGLALLVIGAGLVAAIQIGGQTASKIRVGRQRLSSIKNLEKIASALNAYASDHGAYPAPYTTDRSGRRLHSWRVAILPYLGEEGLYNRIDKDVAWNEGDNEQLMWSEMPAVFRHPELQGWGVGTVYQLVTGTGTLFPATGPLGPASATDGATKTILVVEGAMDGMTDSWMEPYDVDIQQIGGAINGPSGKGLGGATEGGVCVATVDGRGYFLPDTTPPLTVQALLTPRGGEPLSDDVLDEWASSGQ